MVLLQAAYLSEITAPQMDFVEALLRMWVAQGARCARKPAEGARALCPLVVDLDKPHRRAPARRRRAAATTHRVLDVEQLSRSMRKRIHGAADRTRIPRRSACPPESRAVDALDQLQRLHKLWCEGAPPRPPAKVPEEKTAGLVFGLNEIHFFVTGGKAFEQPDKKRELTRQEKQDIEVFGRVTRAHAGDDGRRAQLHASRTGAWSTRCWAPGACSARRPRRSGVAIGRLVAMRVGDTGAVLPRHGERARRRRPTGASSPP